MHRKTPRLIDAQVRCELVEQSAHIELPGAASRASSRIVARCCLSSDRFLDSLTFDDAVCADVLLLPPMGPPKLPPPPPGLGLSSPSRLATEERESRDSNGWALRAVPIAF